MSVENKMAVEASFDEAIFGNNRNPPGLNLVFIIITLKRSFVQSKRREDEFNNKNRYFNWVKKQTSKVFLEN